MALLQLYDSLAAADIPAAYDSADATTRIVRVSAGRPLTFYADLQGTSNISLDMAFAPFSEYADVTSPHTPTPPTSDDVNWYSLSSYLGGSFVVPPVIVFAGAAEGVRSVVNTEDRDSVGGAANQDAVWKGRVPLGAGWVRFRIFEAAPETTSFSLSLVVDSQNYIN